MPENETAQPYFIINKRKSGHAPHRGGAWKVAYADFVTAMMALFIVLWLLNTNRRIQKAVAAYFKDPSGTGKLMGSNVGGWGEALTIDKDNMGKLREKLEQAMKQMPKFEQMRDSVEFSVTGEGLRVELLETAKGMFFEIGNARPTQNGEELLVRLAQELGKIPNTILIEGHTDGAPYSVGGEYDNWELSTDRANTARRLMESNGLRPGQVKEVRGSADQQLRTPEDPTNPANRRISVIVQYVNPPTSRSSSMSKDSVPIDGKTGMYPRSSPRQQTCAMEH
jgi:chemotaxis protein MotB